MTAGKPDRELLRQATEWMLRLSSAPADRALRDAAEVWRTSDPAHAVAWQHAERAWRAVALATPPETMTGTTAEEDGFSPVPPPTRPARMRASRWAMAALSLLAVLALSLHAPSFIMNFAADHATAIAEHRSIGLQDGSVVELGAASALDVEFDETRRQVRLLAGEAFFDVKSSGGRPFRVQAGDVLVVVTGTGFNVRLDDEAVAVTVEHGSVEVTTSRHAPGTQTPILRRLRTGDQLIVRSDGSVEQTSFPVAEMGSWRRHRMFVDGATIGEVVAELRRYNSGWIVVTDGNLLRQRVTGLYDLRDPVEALRVLVGPFGTHVRSISPLLTVVSSF